MANHSYSTGMSDFSNNPFDNFLVHLNGEENPNFLWYTLWCLEKSVMAQTGDLLRAIREKMEEKYHITAKSPWDPLQSSKGNSEGVN